MAACGNVGHPAQGIGQGSLRQQRCGRGCSAAERFGVNGPTGAQRVDVIGVEQRANAHRLPVNGGNIAWEKNMNAGLVV